MTLPYGNNKIMGIDLLSKSEINKISFAKCSYDYSFVSIKQGNVFCENQLKSFTVLCFKSNAPVNIECNDTIYILQEGDSAQIENLECFIKAIDSDAEILIAGVHNSNTTNEKITITRSHEHKKVTKPWGHELWINGEHPGYSIKEVMIKSGFRTSLQYHNFKEETNVLFKGNARLIYKDDSTIANDDVDERHLGFVDLKSVSSLHIVPGVLHRIEAISDVVLYETSTPYLDDVIRVQDDKLRYNGRVISEHAS